MRKIGLWIAFACLLLLMTGAPLTNTTTNRFTAEPHLLKGNLFPGVIDIPRQSVKVLRSSRIMDRRH